MSKHENVVPVMDASYLELEDVKVEQIKEKQIIATSHDTGLGRLGNNKVATDFALVRVEFPSDNLGGKSISRSRINDIRELYDEVGETKIDNYLKDFEISILDEILTTKLDKIQKNLLARDEYRLIRKMKGAMDSFLQNSAYPYSLGVFYLYIVEKELANKLYKLPPPEVVSRWRNAEPFELFTMIKKLPPSFFTNIRQINLVFELMARRVVDRVGKQWYGTSTYYYTSRLCAKYHGIPMNQQSLDQNNRFKQQLYLSMQSHLLKESLKKLLVSNEKLSDTKITSLRKVINNFDKMNILGAGEVTNKLKLLTAKLEVGKPIKDLKEFLEGQLARVEENKSGLELDFTGEVINKELNKYE